MEQTQDREQENLSPDTLMGAVTLTTPNVQNALRFYQGILGLESKKEAGTVRISAPGGSDIVWLVEAPGAARPARQTTGLYHLAILLPSRQDLARTLRHLADQSWQLQGAADHLVSEALYLADADGNGIEIYRDRPRSEWPHRNGRPLMSTEPLDVEGVMGTLNGEAKNAWAGLPAGARIGHVHLQVSEIPSAESFYCDVLGFDRVMRFGSSASFVSVGGYHHHLGMNIWNSAGAPPPPPGAAGLRWFTLRLPDAPSLAATTRRLEAAGAPVEESDYGWISRDPSGNALMLTA